VTLDRLGESSRRRRSTSSYECNAVDANKKKIDNKDEYPQAVFEENSGGASVKCVKEADNKGSGKQVGNQINGNRFYGNNENIYGKSIDGSVVEMIVLK
jgi:Deoxyribonuclease NucA/NucB